MPYLNTAGLDAKVNLRVQRVSLTIYGPDGEPLYEMGFDMETTKQLVDELNAAIRAVERTEV
jgi:hypothetical protein